MTTPIKISRLYGTHDAQMLETCNTVNGHFLANIAQFSAFDPALDATYSTDFQTITDDAMNYVSDSQMVDVVAHATEQVELKMAELRLYYQKHIKYYVELAYPIEKRIWDEFGYNDYASVRSNQAKMILFLVQLHVTAEKHKDALIAQGFDQTKIDDIKDRADELLMLNKTQEMYKGDRTTHTHRRIVLLNTAYLTLKRISRAAQAVFWNDPGLYSLFQLPWTTGGGIPSDVEITGTVASGDSVTIVTPPLTSESIVTISNTGDVPLRFCGSETFGMACDVGVGVELNPGDSQSVTLGSIAMLGSNPTFLNVSHTIAPLGSPVGEYSVLVI